MFAQGAGAGNGRLPDLGDEPVGDAAPERSAQHRHARVREVHDALRLPFPGNRDRHCRIATCRLRRDGRRAVLRSVLSRGHRRHAWLRRHPQSRPAPRLGADGLPAVLHRPAGRGGLCRRGCSRGGFWRSFLVGRVARRRCRRPHPALEVVPGGFLPGLGLERYGRAIGLHLHRAEVLSCRRDSGLESGRVTLGGHGHNQAFAARLSSLA